MPKNDSAFGMLNKDVMLEVAENNPNDFPSQAYV